MQHLPAGLHYIEGGFTNALVKAQLSLKIRAHLDPYVRKPLCEPKSESPSLAAMANGTTIGGKLNQNTCSCQA